MKDAQRKLTKVCPLQNPRYDIFVSEDGRRKKLKKALPPGLSAHDERVLKTVQRKAYRYEWWIGMFFSISSNIYMYIFRICVSYEAPGCS